MISKNLHNRTFSNQTLHIQTTHSHEKHLTDGEIKGRYEKN